MTNYASGNYKPDLTLVDEVRRKSRDDPSKMFDVLSDMYVTPKVGDSTNESNQVVSSSNNKK